MVSRGNRDLLTCRLVGCRAWAVRRALAEALGGALAASNSFGNFLYAPAWNGWTFTSAAGRTYRLERATQLGSPTVWNQVAGATSVQALLPAYGLNAQRVVY